MSDKKVLIIGAGVGGIAGIKGLRAKNKDCAITLVEPKDYCEVNWGSYRAPFEEWIRKGGIFPLAPFCETNAVTHKRTLVTSLKKGSAVLASGETVVFDVCLIAIGAKLSWAGFSRGPYNMSSEERMAAAKSEGDKLLDSKSVVICGGGFIGTELCGDVVAYAKKAGKSVSVTLVHSGDRLCPDMNPEASARIKEQLETRGATVLLNEKATDKGNGLVQLSSSGKTIEAETVVMATGISPASDFLKSGELASSLNEYGWIETDDFFRVKGGDGKIFAIGDCCTTLYNAGNQVLSNIAVIGANINASLVGSADESKLKKFAEGPSVYAATTGTDQGVVDMGSFWTTWFFPWLKNTTMFYFRARMELGIKSVE